MRRLIVLSCVALYACSEDPAPPTRPGPTSPADMAPDQPQTTPDTPPDTPLDQPDDGGPDQPPPTNCATTQPASEGQARTAEGVVQGARQDEVWAFKGMRYAAAPTGALRFRPPAPPACAPTQPKPVTDLAPKCAQRNPMGMFEGDEDCLALNVWTPATDEGARPVMVFIHGGGNIVGSAREEVARAPLFDGAELAQREGAVVVTLQYRLGPLGFLALPELLEGAPGDRAGNLAIQDQIAALRWVQDYIAGFGGDPGRVMIFGESAGALNVCTLLASPLASGLFHSALMQSGGCVSKPRATALAEGARAVARTTCADAPDALACLRELDVAALLDAIPSTISVGPSAQDTFSFDPVIDGHVLTDASLSVITRGEHNRVPIVIGTNADEMASEAIFPVRAMTEAQAVAYVRARLMPFGAGAADRVLAAYPIASFPSPQEALIQIFTDATWTCPTRLVTRAMAMGQDEPVYRYFFSRRATTSQGETPASHGIELLYVFGALTKLPLYNPAMADLDLSVFIQRAWAALAREGAPDDARASVRWSAYEPARDNTLVLDATVTMQDGVRAELCAMWDEVLGL